ncbi:MAG: hypothetical protein Q7J27_01955, partial [Syntrophales bacterium]|nr:hypothetical protein [Syntrophales bacterium]
QHREVHLGKFLLVAVVTPFDEFVEFRIRRYRRDVVADIVVLQDLAYPLREEGLLAVRKTQRTKKGGLTELP